MKKRQDPWISARQLTQARIGLDRSGNGIGTRPLLEFQMAHAEARDAIHLPWALDDTQNQLQALQIPTIQVRSNSPDRPTYLRRPDLGRTLADESRIQLQALQNSQTQLALCLSDGLSSPAVQHHAVPFLEKLITGASRGKALFQSNCPGEKWTGSHF